MEDRLSNSAGVSKDISEHISAAQKRYSILNIGERRSKREKLQVANSLEEFGYVDIKKLEHCARTLQKSIRLLLNEAPDVAELNEMIDSGALDEATLLDLSSNKLVRLSAQLKTRYKCGQLNIFDEILNNYVDVSLQHKDSSEKDVPRKVDSLLPAAYEFKVPSHPSGDSEVKTVIPNKQPNAIEDLPPFPEINDPKLYRRVFIHKSIVNNKSYLQKAELIASHNERLEFLGDSVLNNLVTGIIFNKFPQASEGELSKIRSSLVNNVTLAEFSIKYGFDRKLRTNISDLNLKDATQKVYADVFEAYVGALAIERGSNSSEIQRWLEKLMESKLNKYDKQIKSLEEINKDAKSELYSLIGSAASHPQYEVLQTGDGASSPFIIQCKMGDEILGVGSAPGNKEAGLRAAMQALKNKHLLEKYSQIRFNTDRNISTISHKSTSNASDEKAHSTENGIDVQSLLPLVAENNQDIDIRAKNMLYSVLGKRSGAVPVYEASKSDSKEYKVELRVNGVLVAIATDMSKKKATTRAAMTVMSNKDVVEYLCSM